MKKILVSTFSGAFVAFVWSTISWMILPWHNFDIKSFAQDGQVITDAIKVEALESGIYIIPNLSQDVHTDPEKQVEWQDKSQNGPYAYMSIRKSGTHFQMGTSMAVQFLTELIVAAIGTWLITLCALKKIWQCALMVSIAVGAGAILAHVPYWNWWSFPSTMTLVNIVDTWATWFLSGIAMAKVLNGNMASEKKA